MRCYRIVGAERSILHVNMLAVTNAPHVYIKCIPKCLHKVGVTIMGYDTDVPIVQLR